MGWSAAVIRAATAAEIAVNLAIRREFTARSQLDAAFVDDLLKWANGLSGKVEKLLLPLVKGRDNEAAVKELCKLARIINEKRNVIAHRGEFCSEQVATDVIAKCEMFVVGMIKPYEPTFELREDCTR
jgi:hypothetical protein